MAQSTEKSDRVRALREAKFAERGVAKVKMTELRKSVAAVSPDKKPKRRKKHA